MIPAAALSTTSGPACSRSRRTPSMPIGFLSVCLVLRFEHWTDREDNPLGRSRTSGRRESLPPKVPTIRSGPTSRRASAGRQIARIDMNAVKSRLLNQISPVIENQLHLFAGHGFAQNRGVRQNLRRRNLSCCGIRAERTPACVRKRLSELAEKIRSTCGGMTEESRIG